MFYVIKNNNRYMTATGLNSDNKADALKIDAALVQALRAGKWVGAELFGDADDRGLNGIGARIVKVNQTSDDDAADMPMVRNGEMF